MSANPKIGERVRTGTFESNVHIEGRGAPPFNITPGIDSVWGYQPSIGNRRALLDIFAHSPPPNSLTLTKWIRTRSCMCSAAADIGCRLHSARFKRLIGDFLAEADAQ